MELMLLSIARYLYRGFTSDEGRREGGPYLEVIINLQTRFPIPAAVVRSSSELNLSYPFPIMIIEEGKKKR